MYFDRFDICEAYYAFACDYNEGGYATGRREHFRGETESDIFCRLTRIDFAPSWGIRRHGYGGLSENGKAIYGALAAPYLLSEIMRA